MGIPDVHYKGSSDMYAKGSAFLHTIRNLIENDSLWFDIIQSMTKTSSIKQLTEEMF